MLVAGPFGTENLLASPGLIQRPGPGDLDSAGPFGVTASLLNGGPQPAWANCFLSLFGALLEPTGDPVTLRSTVTLPADDLLPATPATESSPVEQHPKDLDREDMETEPSANGLVLERSHWVQVTVPVLADFKNGSEPTFRGSEHGNLEGTAIPGSPALEVAIREPVAAAPPETVSFPGREAGHKVLLPAETPRQRCSPAPPAGTSRTDEEILPAVRSESPENLVPECRPQGTPETAFALRLSPVRRVAADSSAQFRSHPDGAGEDPGEAFGSALAEPPSPHREAERIASRRATGAPAPEPETALHEAAAPALASRREIAEGTIRRPELERRERTLRQGSEETESAPPPSGEPALELRHSGRSASPRREAVPVMQAPQDAVESPGRTLLHTAALAHRSPVDSNISREIATGRGEPQPPAASPEPDLRPPASEPARRVSLLLAESGAGARVAVELAERGGKLHVAVRSADTDLNGSLRRELPGLMERLEHAGFGGDCWSPTEPPETGAAPRFLAAALEGSHRDAEVADSSRPGGREPADGGDDSGRRRRPPEWLDEVRPRTRQRSEETFLWHLQSIR